MPILRAGPFASSIDSFLPEPDPATSSTVPVNCADNDWLTDWWIQYYSSFVEDLDSGFSFVVLHDDDGYGIKGTTPAYDETNPGDSIALYGSAKLVFRYQAMTSFSMTLTYAATAGANPFTNQYVEAAMTIAPGGTTPAAWTDSHSPGTSFDDASISGTQVFTFPASVKPALVFVEVYSDTVNDGFSPIRVTGSASWS